MALVFQFAAQVDNAAAAVKIYRVPLRGAILVFPFGRLFLEDAA